MLYLLAVASYLLSALELAAGFMLCNEVVVCFFKTSQCLSVTAALVEMDSYHSFFPFTLVKFPQDKQAKL